MPYDPTAPDVRSRTHPLNTLLHDLGGSGGMPTADELATIPGGPLVHQEVRNAARRINAHREQGDFQAARREADQALGTIGARIEGTELPEAAATPAPTESLSDIGRRMFNH